MSTIRTKLRPKCIYYKALSSSSSLWDQRPGILSQHVNMQRNQSEPQEGTLAQRGKAFSCFRLVENYMAQLFLANHWYSPSKATLLCILYCKVLFRCKNQWYIFFVSLAHAGVWFLCNGLLALLFSLFYIIRTFDRFLQQGWAQNATEGWLTMLLTRPWLPHSKDKKSLAA